jgi:hypothetical protein
MDKVEYEAQVDHRNCNFYFIGDHRYRMALTEQGSAGEVAWRLGNLAYRL